MAHVVNVAGPWLEADEEIPRFMNDFGAGRPINLRSQRVEVVISGIAISSSLNSWPDQVFGSRLLRAFTSINTTHWGIKIGNKYYDLKMRRWFGRPYFEPVDQLEDRRERTIIETMAIGSTHFTDSDISAIGYDIMSHAPLYHAWFDNCQAFAVNDFAKSIICFSCDAELLPMRDGDLYTPECQAFAKVKDLRILEYPIMLMLLGMELGLIFVYLEFWTEDVLSPVLQVAFIALNTFMMALSLSFHKARMSALDDIDHRRNLPYAATGQPICVPIVWLAIGTALILKVGMRYGVHYQALFLTCVIGPGLQLLLSKSYQFVPVWNPFQFRPDLRDGGTPRCALCSSCYKAQVDYSVMCLRRNVRRRMDEIERPDYAHARFFTIRIVTGLLMMWGANDLSRPHCAFLAAMHVLLLNALSPVTPISIQHRKWWLYAAVIFGALRVF